MDSLGAELVRVLRDPSAHLFKHSWPVSDDGELDSNFIASFALTSSAVLTAIFTVRTISAHLSARSALKKRRAALTARIRAVKRARDSLLDELARLEHSCTRRPGGLFEEIEMLVAEVDTVLGPESLDAGDNVGEDGGKINASTSKPTSNSYSNGHIPSHFLPSSSSSSSVSSISVSSVSSSSESPPFQNSTDAQKQVAATSETPSATASTGPHLTAAAPLPNSLPAPRPSAPLTTLTPLNRRLLLLDDRLIRLLESVDLYSPAHVDRLLRTAGSLPPSHSSHALQHFDPDAPVEDSDVPVVLSHPTRPPSPLGAAAAAGARSMAARADADPDTAVAAAVRAGAERVRRRRREVARDVAGRCRGVDRGLARLKDALARAEKQQEAATAAAEGTVAPPSPPSATTSVTGKSKLNKKDGKSPPISPRPEYDTSLAPDPLDSPTAFVSNEPGADVLERLEKAFREDGLGGGL
ncbi:hypothetical protein HDU93_003065 [Gonapodya sp. JEL0774]|nr:hypothetical protein HDU93_003065 [Gonapodya sp. JEL0774]